MCSRCLEEEKDCTKIPLIGRKAPSKSRFLKRFAAEPREAGGDGVYPAQ